jgi:hypothetical protein
MKSVWGAGVMSMISRFWATYAMNTGFQFTVEVRKYRRFPKKTVSRDSFINQFPTQNLIILIFVIFDFPKYEKKAFPNFTSLTVVNNPCNHRLINHKAPKHNVVI